MSRPPREPGPLRIGEPMRRRIARLRHLDPKRGPTTLDVQLVRDVEKALGCTFEDEVLALFASGVADLVQDAGIDLARVVERTRIAKARGATDELIAIGGHPGGLDFYCVQRVRPEGEPLLLVEFASTDGGLVGRPIVEWVEIRLEIRREVLLNGDEAERKLAARRANAAEVALFQPSLIIVVETEKPTVRRVRHASFGIGEVLSEVVAGGTKKLSVRFESGTKLLIERVLEDVES